MGKEQCFSQMYKIKNKEEEEGDDDDSKEISHSLFFIQSCHLGTFDSTVTILALSGSGLGIISKKFPLHFCCILCLPHPLFSPNQECNYNHAFYFH